MVTVSKEFVGNKFKERRLQLGLSLGDIVRACDSSYSKISQHESGKLIKNANEVQKMCEILCDDGELLAWWLVSYTQLEFPNQETIDALVQNTKVAMRFV